MEVILSLTGFEFYMSNLENLVFDKLQNPTMCSQYVDSIFILSNNLKTSILNLPSNWIPF